MPISTAPVSAITHQMILLIAFPPEILTAFPLARRITIDGAAYQGVDLIDSVKFRVHVILAGAGTLGAPVAWVNVPVADRLLNLRVADPGLVAFFLEPVIPALQSFRFAGGRPAAGHFPLRGQAK